MVKEIFLTEWDLLVPVLVICEKDIITNKALVTPEEPNGMSEYTVDNEIILAVEVIRYRCRSVCAKV